MKALNCFDDWPFGQILAKETTITILSKNICISIEALMQLKFYHIVIMIWPWGHIEHHLDACSMLLWEMSNE